MTFPSRPTASNHSGALMLMPRKNNLLWNLSHQPSQPEEVCGRLPQRMQVRKRRTAIWSSSVPISLKGSQHRSTQTRNRSPPHRCASVRLSDDDHSASDSNSRRCGRRRFEWLRGQDVDFGELRRRCCSRNLDQSHPSKGPWSVPRRCKESVDSLDVPVVGGCKPGRSSCG